MKHEFITVNIQPFIENRLTGNAYSHNLKSSPALADINNKTTIILLFQDQSYRQYHSYRDSEIYQLCFSVFRATLDDVNLLF